ncbi:uncharacterized protein LOC127750138 [Frankliniella occidentalis]|uniref:Uncharacterized protein LOC127750138 n=1 Tax=Frankliniella occidentalis TaxID=133901 RepID=A0A9C6UF91_FRAOC|nr:uncharacterized protein LOC127750138 [Frankliniella occidentalis]
MDQLADDVLVEVMQYVAVQDLLALRLACKRFRDLALHRDVWRLRRLKYDDPMVCTVLRLAPCLLKAHFQVPSGKCHMLYTTRCAVADLTLMVYEEGTMHAAFAIRNQEGLGRLRRVEVNFREWSQPGLPVLLGTLASTAGLICLDITGLFSFTSPSVGPLPAVHNPVSTASLKRFQCILQLETEPFCTSIISAHSSTLEVIILNVKWPVHSGRASSTLAPLLADVPNLRWLECPLLPGMEALAACETLRSVVLHVQAERIKPIPPIQEGLDFLRRATQLHRVHLYVCVPHLDHPGDVAVDLALALAASGKSRVRELTIRDEAKGEDDEFSLHPLLRALPSLPALRDLSVEGPPAQLLPGISPATAPALRMLEFQPYSQPMGCVHAWLHSDQVRDVLSSNPRLHIGLLIPADACENEDCQACSQGCHQDMWGYEQVGFFSHDPSKKCSQHDSDYQWYRLPL